MAFLHQWRMPLLFFISGIGTVLALRSRSIGAFLVERHNRLLVPLVFGMLVIVPPQVYCERVAAGQSFSSYFAFWKTIFDFVPYPQGNTSWHHLWFVVYLFVYAILVMPLLALMQNRPGGAMARRLLRVAGPRWQPVASLPPCGCGAARPALALAHDAQPRERLGQLHLPGTLLPLRNPRRHGPYGCGNASPHNAGCRLASERAVLASLLVDDALGVKGGYPYAIEYTLLSALTWFWILAAAGYGRRYLSFRNRFVDYASEGIYPFYILHQTVIIVLGAPMMAWSLGAWPKLFLLLVTSFVASWLLYALAIRPLAWMRPLFGMKPQAKGKGAAERSTAPSPELSHSPAVLGTGLVE